METTSKTKTNIADAKCIIEISEKTLRELLRDISAYKVDYMGRKEFESSIYAYSKNHSVVSFLIDVDVDGQQESDDYYLSLPVIYDGVDRFDVDSTSSSLRAKMVKDVIENYSKGITLNNIDWDDLKKDLVTELGRHLNFEIQVSLLTSTNTVVGNVSFNDENDVIRDVRFDIVVYNEIEEIITIEIPKGFMNIGVSTCNHFIANTNDSANWDTIRFPLPDGNWDILSIEGKIVTLNKVV